jgi:hypothetical protein
MDYIDGVYAVQCAGVEPKPYIKKKRTPNEELELEARLAASGSVIPVSFATPDDNGAEDDYMHFEEVCTELGVKDVRALWDKARPEVEAEFRIPENRATIIAEAEKVRLEVFPWATLPIVDVDPNQNGNANQP